MSGRRRRALSPAEVLAALQAARADVATADKRLCDAVAVALSPGVDGTRLLTVSEVAMALGVTRQAVYKRFGHLLGEAS